MKGRVTGFSYLNHKDEVLVVKHDVNDGDARGSACKARQRAHDRIHGFAPVAKGQGALRCRRRAASWHLLNSNRRQRRILNVSMPRSKYANKLGSQQNVNERYLQLRDTHPLCYRVEDLHWIGPSLETTNDT